MISRVFIKRKSESAIRKYGPTRLLRIYKRVGDFVRVGDLLFITIDGENISDYVSSVSGNVKKVYYSAGNEINFNRPVLEILQTNSANVSDFQGAVNKDNDFVTWNSASNKTYGNRFQIDSNNSSMKDFSQNSIIGEKKVTSYAKMLADKIGVPLREVVGTGPGGWITRSDVLKYASRLGMIDENFDDVNMVSHQSQDNQKNYAVNEKENSEIQNSQHNVENGKARSLQFKFDEYSSQYKPLGSYNDSTPSFGSQYFPSVSGGSKFDLSPVSNTRAIVESSYANYDVSSAPSWCVSFKVDVTKVVKACKHLNSYSGHSRPRVTVLCYVIKAIAETLNSFPVFNSMIGNDGELIFNDVVNIGLMFGLNNAESAIVSTIVGDSQLDVITIARQIQEIISDKLSNGIRRIDASSNKRPSVMLYDLSEFGSVGKIPGLADGHVVTFSVGDVFEVEISEDNQYPSNDLYFITFSIIADRRFSDSTSVYDFIRIFKKNMADEANKLYSY